MQSDCIAVALREASIETSAPDNEDTIYTCTVVDSSAELKHRHYMEEIKHNESGLISQEQRELYENYSLDILQESGKSGDIHALHELVKRSSNEHDFKSAFDYYEPAAHQECWRKSFVIG